MHRAALPGCVLEYEMRGSGEHVVLMLHLEHERGVAEGLAGFFARHPISKH